MSDEEKRAIYLELLADKRREDYPQPNITRDEYAEMAGISKPAAYARLELKVRRGELKKATGIRIADGRPCNIYWAVSLEEQG